MGIMMNNCSENMGSKMLDYIIRLCVCDLADEFEIMWLPLLTNNIWFDVCGVVQVVKC